MCITPTQDGIHLVSEARCVSGCCLVGLVSVFPYARCVSPPRQDVFQILALLAWFLYYPSFEFMFQVVALLACSQCYPMQDVFQVVALLACSRHLTPTPAPGPVLMAGVSLNLVCTSSRSRARSPVVKRRPIYVINTQPLHEANTWGQAGAQTFITRGLGNGSLLPLSPNFLL